MDLFPVRQKSHHFVETRRVFQAISDFDEGTFFVVLLCSDVVELERQVLNVGTKVFYCLQAIGEVTGKEHG